MISVRARQRDGTLCGITRLLARPSVIVNIEHFNTQTSAFNFRQYRHHIDSPSEGQ
jgi:hypothetical protein